MEQGKYHIDNEQQWSYLLSKYNKLVESRVSYTYTLKDWMPLTIVLPDSKEISKNSRKYVYSSIQRVAIPVDERFVHTKILCLLLH